MQYVMSEERRKVLLPIDCWYLSIFKMPGGVPLDDVVTT